MRLFNMWGSFAESKIAKALGGIERSKVSASCPFKKPFAQ